LDVDIVDLGRGSEQDFIDHRREIPGRAVLVRHEYMFSANTIRRRAKYGWAVEHGAVAFLVANNIPGIGPISGSAGTGSHVRIPAVGVSSEAATILGVRRSRIRLLLRTANVPRVASNIIAEFPGQTAEWVVLGAHLDGHAQADSALDNATGVAAALAVARGLAPAVGRMRRGLRVCIFTFEEWDLTGSRHYVDSLSEADRSAIACNLTLDTVAGGTALAAMTSGFRSLPPVISRLAARLGVAIGIHEPLGANSDHYSFAIRGIPAIRLIAGFDEPHSNLRYVLTSVDTVDKAAIAELETAVRVASHLCASILSGDVSDLR
jgi:Zn-dependent M28 family amino/carboxypeptidase